MYNVICQICLRTNIITKEITSELFEFFDELCDFKITENSRYKFCTVCAHLLKKFYKFRGQCMKALKILKSLKNMRNQQFRSNLHEHIPSSLGIHHSLNPCTIIGKTNNKIDLVSNKPILLIEPSENKIYGNLPTLHDNTEVKTETTCEDLDSYIETEQITKCEIATVGSYSKIDNNGVIEEGKRRPVCDVVSNDENGSKDDNMQSEKGSPSNFEEHYYHIKLELSEDDTFVDDVDSFTNDGVLEGLPVDKVNDTDIKMDIINKKLKKTAIRHLKTIPVDKVNDTDIKMDIINKKPKKTAVRHLKTNEIKDVSEAEALLETDATNLALKNRVQYLKLKEYVKEKILELFETEEYDLGDGLKISKEQFIEKFEAYDKSKILRTMFVYEEAVEIDKVEDFLHIMLKMNDTKYDAVFDIEYLDTEEKKIQEFNGRKDTEWYKSAAFKCELCYKCFNIEGLLHQHRKKHEPTSGDSVCHICSIRFNSRNRYGHYFNNHTAVYSCKLCLFVTYYYDTMTNHYGQHIGVKYRCKICDGVYPNKSTLNNHKRIHVTSHVCTICAQTFVSDKGLLFHRKLKHKGVAEPDPTVAVSCAECGLTFHSQKVYNMHLRISHRPKKRKLQRKAVIHRNTRASRGHWMTASEDARTVSKGEDAPAVRKAVGSHRTCSVCQLEVPNTSGSSLYKHHREHHPGVHYQPNDTSTAWDYLCEECGKKFIAYTSFLDHKNIHTGARPYLCKQCPKSFATACRLWLHSARHRPPTYECGHCGKLFKSSSNRNNHAKIHTNDRRFNCEVCSAKFLHAASLREHIRGVHNHERRIRKKRNKYVDK